MKKRKFKRSFKIVMLIICISMVSIGVYKFKDLLIQADDNPRSNIVKNKTEIRSNETLEEIDYEGDLDDQLKILAKSDNRVYKIIEHQDQYPEEILRLLLKRPESIDFALGFLDHDNKVVNEVKLKNTKEVPSLYQWDTQWGYQRYGDNYMGITGCGPTVLSMAAIHLTKDNSLTPYKIAQLAESNGHYATGQGTSWSLFNATSELIGVQSKQLGWNKASITNTLSSGGLVVLSVGPGDFTSTGHFILIVGEDKAGNFIIRDPNSVDNTNKTWSYDTLANQTANLWALYV